MGVWVYAFDSLKWEGDGKQPHRSFWDSFCVRNSQLEKKILIRNERRIRDMSQKNKTQKEIKLFELWKSI